MANVKVPLKTRLHVAVNGVRIYFSSFKRVAVFIFISLLGWILINALFDIELLWTLITLDAQLSFRLEAIRDVLLDPSGLPLPNMLATIIMSLLFGYVISATLYVAFRQKAKANKSGGVGILFGVISGGCAACGTSLLAPLFTTIGITTTSAALSFALFLNVMGILILLYSAYKVSLVVAQNK